jgi:hypothetical protein
MRSYSRIEVRNLFRRLVARSVTVPAPARARAARIRMAPTEHHIHHFNDEAIEPRTIAVVMRFRNATANEGIRSICNI